MQKRMFRGILLTIAAMFMLAAIPATVLAHDGDSDSGSGSSGSSSSESEDEPEDNSGSDDGDTQENSGEALKQRIQELKQQRKEALAQRLDNAKLRVCEGRKKNINAIMSRGVVRAENQIELFTTIAAKVEAFYVKKGKVLSNYDALVAAVSDAKTKAQSDIATLESLAGTFDCSSDDPKGDVDLYKAAAQAVREDLKDFRTSVKNLIVGVKSVQSTEAPEAEGDE